MIREVLFIMIGIYKITNTINQKCYIGKSLDVDKRIHQHKYNINSRPYLQNAINKYDINNFTFEIIESGLDKNDYGEREKYWISYYNSMAPNGYNLTSGGENYPGCKMSDIVKNKISVANKGKIFSDLTRQRMSKSAKIKYFSDAHKNNMSLSKLGKNNGFYGKHHTEESKYKISKKLSGVNSPNYGKSGHMKGKHHSDETKLKLSNKAKVNSIGNKNVVDKIWINNGILSKRVSQKDVDFYTQQGFVVGRIMNRKCNCICKICGQNFIGKSHNSSICDICKEAV